MMALAAWRETGNDGTTVRPKRYGAWPRVAAPVR
jgi:hypothetical protein